MRPEQQAELELAIFPVREVGWEGQEGWREGALAVDRERLRARVLEAAPALAGCRLHLVRPGEEARVASILDVVEPRCDLRGEGFPGQLAPLERPAQHFGRRHLLSGLKVVGVGQIPGVMENQYVGEAIADWSGPASVHNHFAQDHAVVVECLFHDSQPLLEREDAARRAMLIAALHLAALTLEVEPAMTELHALGPVSSGLPRVAYICPVMTLTDIHRSFVYGLNVSDTPAWLSPQALTDGALVSGNYDIASTRNPTALYQRNPVLEAMRVRHGHDLDFVGVVVSKCLINGYAEKRSSADLAAKLCQEHGVQGVVIGIEECGHAFADQMLTCSSCEQLAIGTVLLLAESAGPEGDKPGALAFAREADAVVSMGNMDEEVDLPAMPRVIGSGAIEGRHQLGAPIAGPLRTGLDNLLAATSQTGAGRLRAVAW